MKPLFLTTILLIGLFSSALSQSGNFHIRGVVQDRETKEPIPFASVSLLHSTRGTAADEKGVFEFALKQADINGALKISAIGFISKVVRLDSIKDILIATIALQSDIVVLKEIEVSQTAINPVYLINAAIDSISKNYETKSFNLEFYSEMTASNAVTKQEFKVESILLGYYQGYATTADKKFEILKKRAKGDNPLKTMNYAFWPTLEMHRADLIAHPEKTGILNEKYLDKFTFKYLGVLTYDTDTLYHIEYVAPKPTAKITGYGIVPTTYKGTIYITTTRNAIVRHDIETDQFSYSIIYKKIDTKYFPYFISGERRLYGENLSFSKVYNLVRLTNVELEKVKVIDYKTNEFQNLSELPDDNEYWDLNYPVDKN